MSKKKIDAELCSGRLEAVYDSDDRRAGQNAGHFLCDLAEGHEGKHRHQEKGRANGETVKFTVKW